MSLLESERRIRMGEGSDGGSPGPGTYSPEREVKKEGGRQSMFRSRSKRELVLVSIEKRKGVPGPAYYF